MKTLAYLIIVLQIIGSWWEPLFLMTITLKFSHFSNGGIYVACAFIIDALIRIICSRNIAAITEKLTIKEKLGYSLLSRVIFLTLCLLIPFFIQYPVLAIIWLTAVCSLNKLSDYCNLHLKYYFANRNYISLAQNSSISSLGTRGGMIVASVLAFLSLDNNILEAMCLFFSACMVISAYLRYYYFRFEQSMHSSLNLVNTVKQSQVVNSLSFFLFWVNLFVGAIGMLLTKAVVEYKLFIYEDINLVTFFYVGFFIVNCIGVFKHKLIEVKATSKNLLSFTLLIPMSCLGIYWLKNQVFLASILAFVFGVIYGISLLINNIFCSQAVQGESQAFFAAKLDSSGRYGFLISQAVAGILINYQIPSMQILLIFASGFILYLVFMYKSLVCTMSEKLNK